MGANTDPDPVLVLENLSKVFQGQRALDGVDFEVRAGEVHALLGPNGSGKSTLIKILAGYHQPEPGATGRLHGESFEPGSAAGARQIRFIHQDLGLVGGLDAVDNLALGSSYRGRWWLSDRRERAHARDLLAEYGIALDVAAPLDSLARARQTMVAIVRALGDGLGEGSVLVLDEPTAALPRGEVQRLFALIAELRRRGGAIIYVTHRLPEVFEIADRVTVLRDGRRVATRATSELDHDALVALIVGRALDAFYPSPPPVDRQETVLALEGIRGGAVAEVSLTVDRGEIVGVSGLVGSGCDELLHLAFGSAPRAGGVVCLDGQPVPDGGPHASIAAGLALAPADRKRLGAILDWSLRENLTLPKIPRRGRLGWLSPRGEAPDAATWLQRLDVVPPQTERLFSSLSGGNQQKVVLARWLRCGARAFLLEEPTNGVDMGAKHAIYEALVEVARAGAAVLLSSQDPEELCSVCDRVVVLCEGRVGAVLQGADLTEDRILSESMRRLSPEQERSLA